MRRKPWKQTIKRTRSLLYLLKKLIDEQDKIEDRFRIHIKFPDKYYKKRSVIRKVLSQQQKIFETGSSVPDRIVSISKSYIRPIVRGKEVKPVEFGAKVNMIQFDGINFIEHLSFDPFHEGNRLIESLRYSRVLMGRITLNPLSHIDPMGTVVFPFILFIFGGMVIGWAKPVPFIPRNLSNPKRDPALIDFAGPLANLLTALIVTLLLAVLAATVGYESMPRKLWEVLELLVYISTILFFFNLIPVPPLDGHHILRPILPDKLERLMMGVGPFGILIALLVARPMISVLMPVISLVLAVIKAF